MLCNKQAKQKSSWNNNWRKDAQIQERNNELDKEKNKDKAVREENTGKNAKTPQNRSLKINKNRSWKIGNKLKKEDHPPGYTEKIVKNLQTNEEINKQKRNQLKIRKEMTELEK